MASNGKVLVAGASGLIGQAALARFVESDYDVVGLSRRSPMITGGADTISLDLMDPAACRAIATEHSDVTHLVYTALFELPGLAPGWFHEGAIERNLAMLRNLFEALQAANCPLEHVSLMHGTKAYGVHAPWISLTPEMIPLRERSPRIDHPNFYFSQERYLREQQTRGSWGMTVFRPTVVYGDAVGNNMNPLLPLVVYAALLREAGEPLHRPWPADRPSMPSEAVDADLIAQALVWAATSPSARDQTFNLTNGDVFLWEGVWPAIAGALGMEVGGHRPFSFATELRSQGEAWGAIVDRYELQAPRDLDMLIGDNSFVYADGVIAGARATRALPMVNSTIKVRQAGFHVCMDTEDMFTSQIARLQERQMIPRSNAR
jgi:nucleoside-diphosphate-sugar epimerase